MTDWLVRAEALAPRVVAAADEIERERRLPPALVAALHEAQLYRMLLPRSLGGGELDPPSFTRVIETIAAADASTAWCLCQNNVASIVAAWLPADSAREIFGPGDAVLAWGPGPARADKVPGGYRVTGSWSFASGARHATWLGAHCPVFDSDGKQVCDAAGVPVERTMLFPASAAPLRDIWHVVGLRGTASDAYEVKDLFVPERFSVIRDVPDGRRETGPLYLMTTHLLFAGGFAAVALGLARSLLDALVALAREKTPRGHRGKLRDSAATQTDIAVAEARWRAARMYLYGTIEEAWRDVQRAGGFTMAQRMAIRLAATHVIHEAVAVADFAYHAAGATAIFDSNPFERRFRDIHALAQQVQARRSHYETVGRYLLGFTDTDLQFL
ncbi:MAG TPA: acyl-CoA dehydrogenase family protein [Stellaceae bacterium]